MRRSPRHATTPVLRAHRAPVARLVATAIFVLAPAAALAVAGATPQPLADVTPAIAAEWDGPAVRLDWRGNEFATVEVSFIGARIVVPSDQITRTLHLINTAPEPGVLTVRVEAGEWIPEGAANPSLGEDVSFAWRVGEAGGAASFAELIRGGGAREIAEVPIEAGETVPITISVAFPPEVTGHRNRGRESAVLDFTVRATITGDNDPGATTPGGSHPKTGPSPNIALIAAAFLTTALLATATATTRKPEPTT